MWFYFGALVAMAVGVVGSTGKLNVALHAQSRYSDHGWVAGSEITTSGLLAALRRSPEVARAEVFAPFAYSGLYAVVWDLLIIEGWTGPVPRVIQSLRAHKAQAVGRGGGSSTSPRPLIVLHWCLDTYPTLATIQSLDVDGYLTNSRAMLTTLGRGGIPTLYLPLAADPSTMAPVAARAEYAHPVVYLGQASLTKHRLLDVLTELAPLGLAIYGLGWDRFESSSSDPRFALLRQHWKGVLPKDDIAALYSSASVVVGTTEVEQRSLGMVNNRLFEALACGAVFLSDSFPALVELFDDTVEYHRKDGDAFAAASHLLNNASARAIRSTRGRQRIESAHTYDHRVAHLLPWVKEVFGLGDSINSSNSSSSSDHGMDVSEGSSLSSSSSRSHSFPVDFPAEPVQRPNIPSVLLLCELPTPNPNPNHGAFPRGWDLPLHLGWLPALARLERAGLYRVILRGVAAEDWVNGSFLAARASAHDGGARGDGSGGGRERKVGSSGEGGNAEASLPFEGHALVLLRASPSHPAARALAEAARRHPPFVYQTAAATSADTTSADNSAQLPPDAATAATSSSRSAPQWRARSAVGLLVPRTRSVATSESLREAYDEFDLVAEDGVHADAVSSGANEEDGRSEDNALVLPHPRHKLRFLAIDVGAMRERSEGWDDQFYATGSDSSGGSSSPKWDHAAVVESELDLIRAADRLCGPSFASSRRAVFVVGVIPNSDVVDDNSSSSSSGGKSATGNGGNATHAAAAAAPAMPALCSCGVHIVNMPRPEALPALLRTTKSIEVLANQATVLLAALAAGTRATVGKEEDDREGDENVNGNRQCSQHENSNNIVGGCDHESYRDESLDASSSSSEGQSRAYPSLTALLASEIAKAAAGQPPLAQFDVPPLRQENTAETFFSTSNSGHSDSSSSSAASNDAGTHAAAAAGSSIPFLPPPALKLLAALNAAAFGVRAAAGITFVHPSGPNATISREACYEAAAAAAAAASSGSNGGGGVRIGVRVAVSGFRTPADGVWCLRVDHSEVACFGDHAFDAEVALPSCGPEPVTLQAVLRGGDLEAPAVVRASPKVVLHFA